MKATFLIIIGKHVFFKRDFCTISLQTSLPRRVCRSFPFFRIAFDCTLRTKLDRVPRKRTQDDGWQSGRERFVRISKSRKCGNANNPPKDRESFLKGQTSLLDASVKVSETTTRSAHRADLIPTPVGVITDSSHVYIDHRIFPSESRTKQFPYS